MEQANETICSCGEPNCLELGWPHEWDPITTGDDCVLGGQGGGALRVFCFGDPDPVIALHIPPTDYTGPLTEVRHRVREPYARWGSGYACLACVEAQIA